MKKALLALVVATMTTIPCFQAFAGSGDTAAGAALGLIGGLAIGSAASSGRGRSRRAEDEARQARMETEQLRREQEKERVYDLQRELGKLQQRQGIGQSNVTINMLVFVIVLLFLGIIGLGILALKKK